MATRIPDAEDSALNRCIIISSDAGGPADRSSVEGRLWKGVPGFEVGVLGRWRDWIIGNENL